MLLRMCGSDHFSQPGCSRDHGSAKSKAWVLPPAGDSLSLSRSRSMAECEKRPCPSAEALLWGRWHLPSLTGWPATTQQQPPRHTALLFFTFLGVFLISSEVTENRRLTQGRC